MWKNRRTRELLTELIKENQESEYGRPVTQSEIQEVNDELNFSEKTIDSLLGVIGILIIVVLLLL